MFLISLAGKGNCSRLSVKKETKRDCGSKRHATDEIKTRCNRGWLRREQLFYIGAYRTFQRSFTRENWLFVQVIKRSDLPARMSFLEAKLMISEWPDHGKPDGTMAHVEKLFHVNFVLYFPPPFLGIFFQSKQSLIIGLQTTFLA